MYDETRLPNVLLNSISLFSLSLVDIKQNNREALSITLHPHNPALVVLVASELPIQMIQNMLTLKKA